MVRASPIQTSFSAGEYSPLLEGRVDLERYGASSLLMQNLIPLKQGPAARRGGTKYIRGVKDSTHNTCLIPFQFSVSDSYVIEAGDQYFRFYKNNDIVLESHKLIDGITQADPAVVTTATSHGYSNGDEIKITGVLGMTELNDKFFLVANVTGTTFELQDLDGNDIDSTSYGAWAMNGLTKRVYEVASPFPEGDLLDSNLIPQFQYAQSADVLYLVAGDYIPRSLGRASDTDWSVSEMSFIDGPYLAENATETTLTLSGTTGSVTVTASATTGINEDEGFKSTDVGRLIRFKDPANDWTWLKITAFSSTTSVTATIEGEDPSAGTATNDWRLGVYSDTTGYPTVITFFQERVLLAGASSYPDRYDLTRTGGFGVDEFLFAPSDADGTVTDDAAISGTLTSTQVNDIVWANNDERGLVIGTTEAEWIVRSSSSGEVLTPSNQKADRIASIGGSYVQPISAESGTVYIQRAGRKIYDIIYNFNSDQLKPRDISLACEHITRTGVAQITFQQEPINTAWMRRTDGLLVGMTYYPDEQVFGAHRHVIGGSDVKVKSLSVIPSSDGSRDELYLIVERTIDGSTVQYVEYMTRYYEDDIDREDAFHVDAGITYDGSATSTVTGLDHLEGETVKVMVDGNSHPDLTVSGGSVTLQGSVTGSVIQAGLGNTWAFRSQRPEAGSRDGTSQGKTKRITGFVARLLNSLGLKYGPDENNLDEWDFEQGKEYDTATDLYTGDTPYLKGQFNYDQASRIYMESDSVFPFTLISIMPTITTYDRG